MLVIVPFFATTLYFKNFETIVVYHATFLFLVILTRDLIKDLENFKGDWVKQYQTFPVVFGYKLSKLLITLSVMFTFLPGDKEFYRFNDLLFLFYYSTFNNPIDNVVARFDSNTVPLVTQSFKSPYSF